MKKENVYELLKQGYHVYVICISSAWIRDAQYYNKPYVGNIAEYGLHEEDEEEIEDIHADEDNWVDYSPNNYVETVIALDEKEAIRKVAEKNHYNPQHLCAYDVFEWAHRIE